MNHFVDPSKTVIDKKELRELLKSYFDAGFKMAIKIKEQVKQNDYEATKLFFELRNEKK